MASIDIAAMSSLVQGMDAAATSVQVDQWNLKAALDGAGVDASAVAGLEGVVSSLRHQVPGLKRRLSLAQAIEAAAPGHLSTVRVNELDVSRMPPDSAMRLGSADAEKLRKAGGNLDAHLIASLAKHHNDPYFAAGFAKDLSTDQLADIVSSASHAAGRTMMGPDARKFGQYQHLVRGMGATIATATRSTGALALPVDYAKKWVSTFTAEHGDKDFGRGKAASLGVLLQSGHYSTPFLDTISTAVYKYERSKGGDPVWAPKASVDGSLDPHGDGQQQNPDVLSDVLAAMRTNAQAAHHFFDVGNAKDATTVTINGRHLQVNARLKYLLQDRTWATRDGASDDGRGLGAALDAAATYYRDGHYNGRTSAQIASQTLALLASKIGTGGNNWGFGHTWNIYKGMRPAVAQIVASYLPDVYRMVGPLGRISSDQLGGTWAVDARNDNPGFPAGMPWGAQLDPGLMRQILGTLSDASSDMEIICGGAAATQQQLMTYALAKARHDPHAPAILATGTLNSVSDAAAHSAGVVGWLVNTAFQGARHNEDVEKRRKQAILQVLTIATEFPSFAFVIKGAKGIKKLAFDYVEADLKKARDVALYRYNRRAQEEPNTAPTRFTPIDENVKQTLAQTALDNLLAAGYLSPKNLAQANKDVGGGHHFVAPPREAMKGSTGAGGHWVPDHPPQFNVNSDAYKTWLSTEAPLGWVQNNVIDPYTSAFSDTQ